MALTPEEAQKIKEDLLKQLGNFPEDRREQIQKQVESMTTNQVENFIQQNQLTHLGGQCIFCSIVAGKTKSFKINEDKNNLAILELNPLSKGHTLIIPKEHSKNISEETKKFAENVSKEIEKKLKPKQIKINQLEIMEHALLEIVPLYGTENERYAASEEELQKTQEEIIKPEKEIEIEKTEEIPTLEKIPKLKPRIP